ncbi:hypothetical protein G4228_005945 [Cervus hanglu yarkandensis]|nr:hypothetical protein G4228_005945 [Cervus hanglu yarkandensis]
MKGEAGHMLHNENPNQEGHIWGSMRRTAFILGSGLLLLMAHWNCVTGVTQVPLLVYWTFSGLLLVADVTGKPNFISRYRIQVSNNDRINMLLAILGPKVMGSPLSSITTCISLALTFTMISHCGYHLPFLPSPEFHDYQHQKVDQCYGALGMLDYRHGTDTVFKQAKAYKRHMILLGFTPLS